MNAEIIAVGTELLLGDTINTNAAFLSQELASLGINVYRHTVVGDNMTRLKSAYSEAFARCDLVITTGGLGPTADDITKEAAAAYFGLDMELDDNSLANIAAFFARIGQKMTENNRKQAIFPTGAKILDNFAGTAPGCIIEANGKICILLPGPPGEMKAMYSHHISDFLAQFSTGILFSRTLHMVGIGESAMEQRVADILAEQSNPTVAPYATGRPGETILRISAKAADQAAARALIDPVANLLYQRLGDYIYGEDDATLAGTVVELLKQRGLTLAIAESITGGQLAGAIVDVPGASAVFNEGVVTYSNEAKTRSLGVLPDTLRKYGAVSPQVAEEMAAGAAKTAGANIAISTTGIAGPDGGTAQKPVGLTYIGLWFNGRCQAKELRLFGNRQRIRQRAVSHALDMIRKELSNI
ncbi:MAG: competence/damage-inducible protein A [Defluviitaleaceae bacterium]|nr:competence/damage-inducible protein A [Defluviitaleaceae bacterium]